MPSHNTKPFTGIFSNWSLMSKKKILCFLFLTWLFIPNIFSQEQRIADSLARIYNQNTLKDTAKFELLLNLSFNEVKNLKLGLKYAEELISLSQQSNNDRYLRAGYFLKGTKERLLGNLDEALSAFFKSAELAKRANKPVSEGDAYSAIADIYSVANNHVNAEYYYNKAISALRQSNDSISLASALSNAGDELLKIKKYDSSLLYLTESKLIFDKTNYLSGKAYSLGDMGMVYAEVGNNKLAEKSMNEAIQILQETQDYYPICDYLLSMSDIYSDKSDYQKALMYALRSLQLAKQYELKEQIAGASLKLSNLYDQSGDIKQSFYHYKNYVLFRDSLNNIKSVERMADLRTTYEVSQKQIEVNLLSQQKKNQRNLVISLAVILFLTILILVIVLRNNRNKQTAYKILNEQKLKTDEQKVKAEKTLSELQITQKQLIQSEKMASLGEFTSGLSHEIQNPLNFVNNFSEVSAELLTDLSEKILNRLPEQEKNEVEETVNDLTENLKKISYHGKRAESIVKSMLQHSRMSAKKSEFTDINLLADECLRLSYRSLQAKNKDLQISIEITLDTQMEKILLVPQDLSTVLINIYNNAFYSILQKRKLKTDGYRPQIWLTTKKIFKVAQIRVKDNGMGIADTVISKIYQPFFTTKPTGEGIGLGLFLSYDIIVNEHDGQISVETKEGEYADFVIEIPIKDSVGTDI